jgi:cytochrome P450
LAVWTSSNITAGSDTTGIFLRTLFYQLLTHPYTLNKLRAELDGAAAAGNLNPLASWRQTRELPYLDACVKEAGRIHPPFGLPMERVVPPEGATICGEFIKGGTLVGMNSWVVHRNRDLYGQDCDEWNPNRWLCESDKRRKMENALLTVSSNFPTQQVNIYWSLFLLLLLAKINADNSALTPA